MRARSNVFAVLLIIVGTYFLLARRHLIPDFGPLFHDWWPALLIIAGVILLVRRSRRGG
ncbi:MAG: DUF5668 domain-containing protein [Steroidobacteraceae bacterium]